MGQETESRFTMGAAARQDERVLAGPDGPRALGGRYELGDVIGSGGTATVYEAWDSYAERSVAVKLFHPGAPRADKHRQAEELRILSSLHHPDLIVLHDTGTHEGRPFLVMQLVPGPTLAGRVVRGSLSAEETTEMGSRLAHALAYVHEQGVTHRDVKPANVLLGPDGPKLGDFGIAHTFDGTRVTSTGVVVGTAAYLAPEQVRGDLVGPPADIYALGLVLLECLSGNREYPGPLAESAVARLHRSPVIPTTVSRGFGSLLKRMTALQPARRPTAHEVADQFAALHLSGSATVSATTARITSVAGHLRSKLLPVGAPVAVVSAAALGLMLLNGADAGTPAEEETEAIPEVATGTPSPAAPPSTAWDVMSPYPTGEAATSAPPAVTEPDAAASQPPQQNGPGKQATGNDPAKKAGNAAGGPPDGLPKTADDNARDNVGRKAGNPGEGKGSSGDGDGDGEEDGGEED